MEGSPPHSPEQKPAVIIWYKIYLAVLAFLFLFVVAVGAFLMLAPINAEDLDETPKKIIGIIYIIMGLGLFIPVIAGFFLPKKPWVWVYHLVLICIGMTGCTIVFSIPLLIFWIKPDVKAYFGKNTA